MSNIINKIRLSGTDYTLSATSSGGASAVEVTQAEYDALVSGGTVDPTVFYIITDAQAGDLTQYWTSAQTNSAINAAVSGKVDTSTFNTYSGNVETALSGKQDTLSAGTGIDITDNVISATGGGGGGKAIEAGRGISITTGATADTVSFNLPISAGTGLDTLMFCGNNNVIQQNSVAFGINNKCSSTYIFAVGSDNICSHSKSYAFGDANEVMGSYSMCIGYHNYAGKGMCLAVGFNTKVYNEAEFSSGRYNVSSTASTTFGDSGNTLFSVGNGTADNARHNAFEIRQNGDIYLSLNGQDVKLQDQLGGGGSSYSAGTGIDITNDVISVTGVVETSAITTTITSSSTDAQVPSAKAVHDQLGGMKIVKLTESEYTALVTKDNNTLYVVVPDPSN